MTFDDVKAAALAWPGVAEGTSYGAPALKAYGKLLVRLKEDGDSVVLGGVGFDERDMLVETQPEVFHFTEHYRGYPMVLARLSKAQGPAIRALLLRRWRELAPKRIAQSFVDPGA